MTYLVSLQALSPDHLWEFDGDFDDTVGVANGTNTDFTFVGEIVDGASSSADCNDTDARVTLANRATITGTLDRKVMGGWVRLDSIQLPPKSIYREGEDNDQFNLVLWAGNNLLFEIVVGGVIFQAYSNNVLLPGRTYHILARVEGSAYGNTFALYIDGIKQDQTEPSSGAFGIASLAQRFNAVWGEPTGVTRVGDTNVVLNGCERCRYSYWASFSGANAQLTDTEIREVLFEQGAIPSATITTGTQAQMQTQIDVGANSFRSDAPLNVRVEPVSGGGDFTLSANNITHDPLASIHIQYTGTDTLNYINANGSNASIGSTPNGGTINFITPSTITVSPLIPGTEVRIYESGTETELGGVENSTTSFSLLVQTPNVDVVIHNEEYVYVRVDNLDMTSGDLALPVSQQFDRGYNNP